MAESPAPSPKAILRGHKAQVHAACFVRNNERLVTGDADGYVVLWDLTILRPRAVWRAHENAILGVRGWGEKIITHGRDHKLIVWKLAEEDEDHMSTALPLDDVPEPRPLPWMVHLLEVNTMNFCSFSACVGEESSEGTRFDESEEILIAVPNTLASEAVDIYSLPSQRRIHTVKPGHKNGMAMSLALLHKESCLVLVAAFENGFTSVHCLQTDGQWVITYRSQAHNQPVLSVDLHPTNAYFLTSSADATIAKHPIPTAQQEIIIPAEEVTPTRAVNLDTDERVVELPDDADESNPSLLSAALRGSAARKQPRPARTMLQPWEHPLKAINTKHSGQQSLMIRSDGRIFATAGWDSNVRVYSCKTMKELAVLQWHTVGCYAVAFAAVGDASSPSNIAKGSSQANLTHTDNGETPHDTLSQTNASSSKSLISVKDRRIQQARNAHWIAAGAKDGKVSLWDIY